VAGAGSSSRPDRAPLIDRYLPVFDVHEHHEALVAASPEEAYAALRAADFNRSRVVRMLFAIRTLPARIRGGAKPRPPGGRPLLEEALAVGWRVLEEEPGRELVAGAVTQPWSPVVEFRGMSGPEFVAFDEPGFAKIAWSIGTRPGKNGGAVLTTETRVSTTDAASRRKFRRYWLVFGPGIRLIRRFGLALVRRDLERVGRARSS
jgi:hypothetical protein